jgi:glycosyltransferase involved in cell wall biosynthesis
MRVLIVTGIFPPDFGGPATFVPRIAEALVKRGHEVHVITLSDTLEHSGTVYPFAVTCIRRQSPRLIRVCRVVRQLIRFGRKVDVIFVNGLAFESAIAKFIIGKPVVQKIVGDLAWERATQNGWTISQFDAFQTEVSGWKVELLKCLQRWWVRKADRIVVPSNHLRSTVQRWGVAGERITTVFNGVEPGKRRRGGEHSTCTRIITIARLVKLKRLDLIIEAVAQLPGVELVIVGDGPERAPLIRLANELKVRGRVRFTGQIAHSEIPGLLTQCQLFVLASTHEGLPHAVLEALSAGVPVICTRAGGIPEVVIDGVNGKLIRSNNGKSLVDALRSLVEDPDARARLAEGAARTSAKFDFDEMVSSIESVLLAAAKQHARAGRLSMGSCS